MTSSPSRRDLFSELSALCLAVFGLRRPAVVSSPAPATSGSPAISSPTWYKYPLDFHGSLAATITYSYDPVTTALPGDNDISYSYNLHGPSRCPCPAISPTLQSAMMYSAIMDPTSRHSPHRRSMTTTESHPCHLATSSAPLLPPTPLKNCTNSARRALASPSTQPPTSICGSPPRTTGKPSCRVCPPLAAGFRRAQPRLHLRARLPLDAAVDVGRSGPGLEPPLASLSPPAAAVRAGAHRYGRRRKPAP